MHRRHFLGSLTATAALAVAWPAQAELISLEQISSYFNGLTTAKGRFTQINGDGSRSTGTLYLNRPGRARFEYDPPEESLVMAGGGQVAIFDGRSNRRRPEQYPLKRTPLNIILERNVNLTNKAAVVRHREIAAGTVVALQDPSDPSSGLIELLFAGSPMRLAEWVVTDGGGGRTRVILDTLETGLQFSPVLFSITREIESRG